MRRTLHRFRLALTLAGEVARFLAHRALRRVQPREVNDVR